MVDPKDTTAINMTISEILGNALSGEKAVRQDAESKLQQLALGNFPEFLYNLATELADEGKPVKIRQMAATYIKNSITVSSELRETWTNKMDAAVKEQIKNLILSTLATKFKEVRAAAGLVIAGIVRVDLPLNEKWPTLVSSLSQSAYHENINIRLAAIESLGYICEELTAKTIDATSVDSILSALIQNLTNSIGEVEVVRSSLKAFFHTIKLAEKNFSRQVNIPHSLTSNFNFRMS
jgi:importin subunit beta-1